MSENIDLDSCYQVVTELVKQAEEVNFNHFSTHLFLKVLLYQLYSSSKMELAQLKLYSKRAAKLTWSPKLISKLRSC